jgi:hypothetical protein
VEELRQVCHLSKYNVTVFHPYFIYFDQVFSFLYIFGYSFHCTILSCWVITYQFRV